MEDGIGLLPRIVQVVGNGIVELRNLGHKLFCGSKIPRVPIYGDFQVAEVAIAANMIAVLLGIYGHDSISGTNRESVAVNRLFRHPVPAGIDDKRCRVAGDEACIDTPRRDISESDHSEAMRGNLNESIIARRREQAAIHPCLANKRHARSSL
jgi:hypothetical protein